MDSGMTFKVELLLIVGLIAVSLVLAPMLEGARLATFISLGDASRESHHQHHPHGPA
jgi:hypothetical protein